MNIYSTSYHKHRLLSTFRMYVWWLFVEKFFMVLFFSPSLLMNGCLGNIQWSRASTGLVSCCNLIFGNASCLSFPISFLSFFNPHPSNRVSFFLLFTSLRSSPVRARPFRASMVVSSILVYLFYSMLCIIALPGWRHACSLKKNEG